MENLIWLIGIGVIIFFSVFSVVYYRRSIADKRIVDAEGKAKELLLKAQHEAEALINEAQLKSKDILIKAKDEFEAEVRGRREEFSAIEKRLIQREDHLDKREESLAQREEKLQKELENTMGVRKKLEDVYQKQIDALEKITEMSREDAKRVLLTHIERDIKKDAAQIIRNVEEQTKSVSRKKAIEIISLAIQKCAVDHVVETTTSVIQLPDDEMKGRIIGREGRNIRIFEQLTGVDLVVDDTPEAVVVSAFDPIRREIAKMSLGKLVADGRIHPSRVEEVVKRAKSDIEIQIKETGERVALDMNVHNLNPRLQEMLGKLQYRTSYGQNVLQHSIEVAHLAGIMAEQLGVNVRLARRAGLLHDIGKAIDFEQEGTHTALGIDIAKRCGESPEVLHAVEAHHEDVQPQTVEAILVLVADAISASRPGARRESLEAYIKRLEKLEALANSFEGVEKSYAIQAGREVRIIVKPEEIDDEASAKLARDVAKRIETEMEYPGQIQVTIIRETRVQEIAK